jgi:hypothetical protein
VREYTLGASEGINPMLRRRGDSDMPWADVEIPYERTGRSKKEVKALRDQREADGRLVSELDAAVEADTLEEDTTLYRGVSRSALFDSERYYRHFDEDVPSQDLGLAEVGDEVVDHSFTSWTADPVVADSFGGSNARKLVVTAPAGQPVIRPDLVPGAHTEMLGGPRQGQSAQEHILPRGAVLRIDRIESNTYYVTLLGFRS